MNWKPAVFDISDIMQSFDHNKSTSFSQLIKGKSGDLQKLLKYFNSNKDRDEVNDHANEYNAVNYRIDNSKTVTSKFLEYKKK